MTTTTPITLADHKVGAVLNTSSGSCDDSSLAEMASILREFAIEPTHLWCGGAADLDTAFEEVAHKEVDVLIVLGGDGTIRGAAHRATEKGPYLIPLPGGTMNILPKALYGSVSWQEALRSVLKNPRLMDISGGEVSGQRFFISAICGAPALWAQVREAVRAWDLSAAAESTKIAWDTMFSQKTGYRFDEMHEGEAEALVVICPLISDALENDRQTLEAAVIDVNHAGEVLELLTATALGTWRDAQQVAIVRTKSVSVFSKRAIPILLDGEAVDVGQSADITFIPNAFKAVVADEILP